MISPIAHKKVRKSQNNIKKMKNAATHPTVSFNFKFSYGNELALPSYLPTYLPKMIKNPFGTDFKNELSENG